MKKLKLIFPVVLVSVFTLGVSAQTLQELNTKFNESGQLMQDKKYEEALKGFEEVISMGDAVGESALSTVENAQKYTVQLNTALGRQAASAKNFDEAISRLEKAQELAAKYNDLSGRNQASQLLSQVYLVNGSEAYNAKDYAKAVEVFTKGYEASPNNSQLALYLADSYDQLGNYEEASRIYKEIMALTHSRHAENVAKAKEEWSKSLLVRAVASSKENKYDEVIKYIDEILTFDPENGDALLLPLQISNNAKRYNEVIKRADTIENISDAGKKSDAYFLIGVAYQNTENTDKAIEYYKKVTSGNFVNQAKSAIADLSK